MNGYFYYVAPRDSLDLILSEGILTPREVRGLIAEKKVSEKVLGVSYNGVDASNFPEHVSLLASYEAIRHVANAICFSRTGSFLYSSGICLILMPHRLD